MKKHVFGFALFSSIVASFVLVYAFFSAPSIPSKEAVKPPVSQVETSVERPYSCRFRSNKLSYEILSSEYFVTENKIVTRIRVEYSGAIRIAPSKIYIGTSFSSANNIGNKDFEVNQIVENPFGESREKIVTVVSKLSGGKKINIDENLYVLASVTDYDGSVNYKRSGDTTEARAVLFVYGNNSYTTGSQNESRLRTE